MKKRRIVSNFFVPHKFDECEKIDKLKIVAIVPSFKPGQISVRLINDLLCWNDNITVYIVDDSTPIEYELENKIFEKIRALSQDRVVLLRTPQNKLKAGAINMALQHVFNLQKESKPDIIITLDDDVIITKNSVNNLVYNLLCDKSLGAVCSQCRVVNKNKNFLTRLQGLEYLGFNALRLTDEGFFNGPLVMHGMMTAFRFIAIEKAGLFKEYHLIEDYEITARIKSEGWHVRLAPGSYAWTKVPDTFSKLWKQRARWTYGGITIFNDANRWHSLIQDVIGHTLFLSTLLLIIASFIFAGVPGSIPRNILYLIIIFSLSQAAIWYLFQIWLLRFYREKDNWDWVIRLTLVPEFIYANVLALVLMGSYLFYVFQFISRPFRGSIMSKIKNKIEIGFSYLGYTKGWGTRQT